MSEKKVDNEQKKKRPRGRPKKLNDRITEISNIIEEADMEKSVKKRSTNNDINKKLVNKNSKTNEEKKEINKKTSTKRKISQEEKAIKKIEEIKENRNIKEKAKNKIYSKTIVEILMGILIILILIFLSFWYNIMNLENLQTTLKITSWLLLVIAISIFEVSYKKDDEYMALYGVEVLALAILVLLVIYMPKINYLLYKTVLMFAVLLYTIYYGIKAVVVYTKTKKKYERQNSDIKDIIKK